MEGEVGALSDVQLRDRLKAFPGQDVPPITASTRKTLERRLVKLMTASPVARSTVQLVSPIAPKSVPLSHPTRLVMPPASKRTPSPPIAPLARSVKANTQFPRRLGRTGAAFSSDEEDDSVDSEQVVDLRSSDANATGALAHQFG